MAAFAKIILISAALALVGCAPKISPEAQERMNAYDTKGMGPEEKKIIAQGIMLRAFPLELDELRIWPVERSIAGLGLTQHHKVSVAYKAHSPFNSTTDEQCLVIQMSNAKIIHVTKTFSVYCSGDGAENMMPYVQEFKRTALQNKPAPGAAQR